MIDICKWKIKFLWEMELAAVMVLYMLLGYLYRKYEMKFDKIFFNKKISNILTFLGKNTLFYYAFSGSVRVILYMILNQLNIIADKYIMPIVITGITVILLSVPVKFVNKYLKFVVGK